MENQEVQHTKDFDGWNTRKKKLDIRGGSIFCHEREVWWCALGINIGREHNGGGCDFWRPVLILKFLSNNTYVVVPLTLSADVHKMRIPIGTINRELNSAVVSQIRVIDTKRLISKICHLDADKFQVVRKAVRTYL